MRARRQAVIGRATPEQLATARSLLLEGDDAARLRSHTFGRFVSQALMVASSKAGVTLPQMGGGSGGGSPHGGSMGGGGSGMSPAVSAGGGGGGREWSCGSADWGGDWATGMPNAALSGLMANGSGFIPPQTAGRGRTLSARSMSSSS